MDRNKADAILTVEQGFSKELSSGEGLPVGIKVNTVNGTKGSIGSQYLMTCVSAFAAAGTGIPDTERKTAVINASPRFCYNIYMDYKAFMVPALMVIAVTMVTGFFPALNIVGEKEAGTIEQMNVSPVSKVAFVVCKLIPYWVIVFFMLGMCLLIAWLVFGFVCRGSLWTLALSLVHI